MVQKWKFDAVIANELQGNTCISERVEHQPEREGSDGVHVSGIEFLLLGSVVSRGQALLLGGNSWKLLEGHLVKGRLEQRHRNRISDDVL